MVQSGLVDVPSVSHYRLAAHLLLAFLVFQYLWWTLLTCLQPVQKLKDYCPRIRFLARCIYFILALQITYGAFTAGMDAGFGYNTFPKMGTTWLPATWDMLSPFWLNLIENSFMIQFIHRSLAWLLLLIIPLFTLFSFRTHLLTSLQKKGLLVANTVLTFQFLVGVLTLIHVVPISLAILHQVGGLTLLTVWTWVLFSFRYPTLLQ